MSRLPRTPLARRIPAALAATAAVAALTAGSALVSAGAAGAEPAAPGDIGALLGQAATISPQATAAVQQLIGAAVGEQITGAADTATQNKPQPFMYPAPTLGCGLAGESATVTFGTAQAGPNSPLPMIEADHLRFQAVPTYLGIPKASGLSVAWFNVSTLKGAIAPLDDTLPIVNVPILSKDIATGDGKVFAVLYGSVDYADGKSCTVLPTVGSFDA